MESMFSKFAAIVENGISPKDSPREVTTFVQAVLIERWKIEEREAMSIASVFSQTPGGGFLDLEKTDLLHAPYNMDNRYAQSLIRHRIPALALIQPPIQPQMQPHVVSPFSMYPTPSTQSTDFTACPLPYDQSNSSLMMPMNTSQDMMVDTMYQSEALFRPPSPPVSFQAPSHPSRAILPPPPPSFQVDSLGTFPVPPPPPPRPEPRPILESKSAQQATPVSIPPVIPPRRIEIFGESVPPPEPMDIDEPPTKTESLDELREMQEETRETQPKEMPVVPTIPVAPVAPPASPLPPPSQGLPSPSPLPPPSLVVPENDGSSDEVIEKLAEIKPYVRMDVDAEETPDDEWEVKEIIKVKRDEDKKAMFKVVWKGDTYEDTWEPYEHVRHVEQLDIFLLDNYDRNNGWSKKNQFPKQLRGKGFCTGCGYIGSDLAGSDHECGERDYCLYCSCEISDFNTLLKHERKCLGDKTLSCGYCGRKFFEASHFVRHQETCGQDSESEIVNEECSKRPRSKTAGHRTRRRRRRRRKEVDSEGSGLRVKLKDSSKRKRHKKKSSRKKRKSSSERVASPKTKSVKKKRTSRKRSRRAFSDFDE